MARRFVYFLLVAGLQGVDAASFEARSSRAVLVAAGRVGLAVREQPVLVRVGTRAVFRLAGGSLVARVSSLEAAAGALYEVQVARWLAAEGLLVDIPVPVEQPVEACGLGVTFWQAVDGDWTVPADVAWLLCRLHRLERPADLDLPRWDPFVEMRHRVLRAARLGPADRERLLRMVDTTEQGAKGVKPVLSRGVIHGDASVGNVLKRPDGTLVLFDLEGVCDGPREWDLVVTAVYRELEWHTAQEYGDFCSVYGFDVMTWPDYPAFRAAQELRMTCWLAQRADGDVDAAGELARRLDDLGEPDRPRRWRPF